MIDKNKVSEVRFLGINRADYPKFCDAYIYSAEVDLGEGITRLITDEEAEWLEANEPNWFREQLENFVNS